MKELYSEELGAERSNRSIQVKRNVWWTFDSGKQRAPRQRTGGNGMSLWVTVPFQDSLFYQSHALLGQKLTTGSTKVTRAWVCISTLPHTLILIQQNNHRMGNLSFLFSKTEVLYFMLIK